MKPDIRTASLNALRRLGVGEYSTPQATGELWRAAWGSGPCLLLVVLVLTVVDASMSPLRLIALGGVIGAITGGPGSLVLWLALLGSFAALDAVISAVVIVPVNELGRRVDVHFRQRVIACVTSPVGTAHLEDPATSDKISAVQGLASPGNTPGGAIIGYTSLLSVKLAAFGSILILCRFQWWLGLAVAVGAMVIRRRILQTWFTSSRTLSTNLPGLRRSQYLRDLVLEPRAAKEHRLFALGHLLLARHRQSWTDALEPVWRKRQSTLRHMVMVDLAVLTVAALAIIPIVSSLVAGEISPGTAVVLGGALAVIVPLGGFVPDADFPIRYGCLALPPLLELEATLSGPRRIPVPAAIRAAPRVREAVRVAETVVFEQVGFRYQSAPRPVFERLDLRIQAGTTVAIVGSNGVGKSTIIRLLSRLYEPTSGRICVDGKDLAGLDPGEWRRSMAVIFQDFVHYELSLRDNVTFGALELRNDTDVLEHVAAQAGLSEMIRRLPRGWDTTLSPRYREGTEFSGGQWQRVALARALFAVQAGASLLVLDEPTASLDVRAEAHFYERFLELTQGTTAILVSHRFSTVRRADRICVIEDGRVTEDGAHEYLLELDGTYARMFHQQAARFAND
jgi:ATP-binding cassette subfamily B protein